MTVKRPPARRPRVAGHNRPRPVAPAPVAVEEDDVPVVDVPVVDIPAEEPPVDEVEESAPRSRLPLVLVVIAAVLVGLGSFFLVRSNSVDHGVDTRAMTEVNGQVKDALEKIFSYSYDKVDEAGAAAREVLAGTAVGEYDKLITQVKTLAPEQRLVLATRVTSIGAKSVDGDRAELLVFLDQVSTRVDTGKTSGSAAALSVTAQRQNGRWKIVELIPR
jgi:Mce-associated membrane protein